MNRRRALKILSSALALEVIPSQAQQNRLPVVGVPLIAAGSNDPIMMRLREGLSEYGYVDGKNIRIEHRSAKGNVENLPTLLTELVQLKVDVIVAGAEPIVRAATRSTITIPIVMVVWDNDPVLSGAVQTLNRPGGNVTGIYTRVEETVGKRLELIKELLPGATRIGVLYDRFAERQFAHVGSAAAGLGFQVVAVEIEEPYDFHRAFRQARVEKAGAVSVLFSPHFYVKRARLVEAATAYRMPTIFQEYSGPKAGGLMSYGPRPSDTWLRAGYFVDRILKGAKASELPVEQPDVYSLVINMKTAKSLNLTVPESILLRADEIIR
jgi:putative ABC transport system substrate-binding protein